MPKLMYNFYRNDGVIHQYYDIERRDTLNLFDAQSNGSRANYQEVLYDEKKFHTGDFAADNAFYRRYSSYSGCLGEL
jgi:hypothetical protein